MFNSDGPMQAESGGRCKPDYEKLIAKAKEEEKQHQLLVEALEPFAEKVRFHREFDRYSYPEIHFMAKQELRMTRERISKLMEQWEQEKESDN